MWAPERAHMTTERGPHSRGRRPGRSGRPAARRGFEAAAAPAGLHEGRGAAARGAQSGCCGCTRGVYAVGHVALTLDSRRIAAVMACGPGALLSHRAAGEATGLLHSSPQFEVTVPRGRKPKPGIVVHRSRLIHPEDRSTVRGIPVTSVARTLVDLADVVSEQRLAKALHEAEVQRVFDLNAIERDARPAARAPRQAPPAPGPGRLPARSDVPAQRGRAEVQAALREPPPSPAAVQRQPRRLRGRRLLARRSARRRDRRRAGAPHAPGLPRGPRA